MTSDRIPLQAAVLGYSGVLPFAALALLSLLEIPVLGRDPLQGFLIYGAVILSFLGGIRWGSVTSSGSVQGLPLLFSVIPSLWATLLLWFVPSGLALWGMALGFALMGLADWARPVRGIAPWMRQLRVRLSVAVIACHLIVIFTL